MKTVLLHTCCGPCGFSATKFLNGEFNIKYYWHNPNIQPPEEYEKRLNVAQKLFSLIVDPVRDTVSRCDISNGVDDYNEKEWLLKIKDIAKQKDKRCAECYRLRLMMTAQKSKELRIDFFSTTLLISPYQQHDILKKTGEDIARQVGVNFYYYDGRPNFYKNLNEFKKSGLYTQKYCGCMFSKNEK
ncbi:MAG: epoxyqueuosine reductase QueH [Elusimicrobia bacterium]|nr:epoxyqueuosine reductase QueH [Elusimicrobiota bacterium]